MPTSYPWGAVTFTPGKGGNPFSMTYPKNPPKKTTKTKSNLQAQPKTAPRALASGGSFVGGGGTAYNTQRKVPLSTTSFSNYQGAYNTQPRTLPGVNSFTNYAGAYNTGSRAGWPNLPVPQGAGGASVEQLAAASGPDWMDMLNKMMKPQGPNYQDLIAALANPGKIGDIATPDLHYIFQRYDPTIRSAWQGLGTEIEGMRQGAVAREGASQEALKQGFAQTAGDVQAASQKATTDLTDLAKRLNVEEGMLTTGANQRVDQANRLAGIADILGKQDLASAQTLATARGANYDTMGMMAKGAESRGLADLASLIAAGQTQAELATQDYYSKARMAEAEGRTDLAKIYAGHMGQQQQNQMDMIKLWSQLKNDYETAEAAKAEAAAANNPYQETTEDVYQDQAFWDSINALAQGDPTASALLTKTRNLAGSDISEMQKLLAGLSSAPKPRININPFSGGKLGKLVVSDKARAEQVAAQKLLEAYNNYGGAFGKPTTKTTIQYKSPKKT